MFAFSYVLTTLVSVILSVMQMLMLTRAILSWLPVHDEMSVVKFVYGVTEPVIIPFRLLLGRFDALNGFPIDIPFFAAFFAVSFAQTLLPAII